MAMNFPADPTVGQEYEFPPHIYMWDGEKWVTAPGSGAAGNGLTYVSETAPEGAEPGSTWFCSANGITYILYEDVDSTQWVISNPNYQATTGSLTPEDIGAVNKAGDTMTGDLSIASASNTGMLKFGSNNQQYLQASSDNNIYLFANNGKIVFKGLNLPVVRVGSTDHLIYHAGNKPTNKDVNAGRVTQEIPFGNNSNAITTAQFITLLDSHGAFDQFYWYARGTWSYASNQVITDTGCGNVHLAGCVIEVFHKYGNGATDGGYTIRVTGPTTTGGTGTSFGDWVYVNNGESYSPGWRRMYNTKLPPTALEVGAASIERVDTLESELRTIIAGLL